MNSYSEILFSGLNIENGLSNSTVKTILQDYLGFMWFGTQDGLNRYDGYDFKIFRSDSEKSCHLSNNIVNVIFEDSSGVLWIGTDDGLNIYDRKMDNMKRVGISNFTSGINSETIRTIYEDNEKNLWIGTYGGGLICLDPERNLINCFRSTADNESSISSDRVSSVIQDKQGNIWAGTWGKGLNIFNKRENKFLRFINDPDDVFSLSENKVDSMFCDRAGVIWAGTTNGLNRYDNELNRFMRFNHDPEDRYSLSNRLLSNICEDKHGNFWIGTKEGGLNYFDKAENKFYNYKDEKNNPYSIGNNSILNVYSDRSGILWVGTYGSGLRIYKNQTKKFHHYFEKPSDSNSINSNKISCFAEDKRTGNLYIGTADKGITIYLKESNKFIRLKENMSDSHQNMTDCMIQHSDGNIYIGTSGSGLVKFDHVSEEYISYRFKIKGDDTKNYLYVFSIHQDDDGYIWFGTAGKGVNRFDPEKEETFHYSIYPDNQNDRRDKRIRKIICKDKNTLILGSSFGGLLFFDKVKKKFSQYKNDPKDPKSISGNFITDILKDSKNNIWVGTIENGLNKMTHGKKGFKRYSTNEGLPNNCISGILEDDDGYIWISSNKGISKLNPESGSIKNYDVRDGLQSNEFNPWACLKLKSGKLVFGGINGFNIFDPSVIKDNLNSPEIVFTDFKIFNKEVKFGKNESILKSTITLTDEINLTYKESVFSFEFSALDFNIPGKNLYAYKMKGFDKDWINSGTRRFATYTNLDAGEYEFTVIGSNNDGIWNKKGKSIKINISPPFWKTIWFKSLSAVSVLAASGSIYQSKINRLRRERKAQEAFTKKLLDTQENERKRIAGELHDSIGQDLLISKNKLQMSLNNSSDIKVVIKNINEVTEVITDTLKNVREISYSLHPYQIERLGLSKAISSIIDRLKGTVEIKFTINIDNIDKTLYPESEISIYRIIQECMNNIIKHSKAKEVILNVSREENYISILIDDDGVGFSNEKLIAEKGKHGFGIQGMKERIRLINGEMNINSNPGEGTSLNFKIPI
ncbi:MAG TPA: two-component regulator propeller domain-containing protein [Ignavibacteria bacterium]|nr:two-component regulator propeller domain-containing protein [Ignavibacteria bacterium]